MTRSPATMFRLAPASDPSDFHAAGYDGNAFLTEQEAVLATAEEGLRDTDWIVVAVPYDPAALRRAGYVGVESPHLVRDGETMIEFCEREGVRIACEAAPEPSTGDWKGVGAHHWKVTLRRGNRRLTTEFHQGSAHTSEPTAADVLSCLVSDAVSVENARDFEDWASDLGYDADSRKAERLYKECARVRDGVRRFLPDYDLFDLANLEH